MRAGRLRELELKALALCVVAVLVQEDCDRDFFMTPEEAVAYGMIDSIVPTKTSHLPKPPMPNLLF